MNPECGECGEEMSYHPGLNDFKFWSCHKCGTKTVLPNISHAEMDK